MKDNSRRSFVKKTAATGLTFTFAGLIRAHGQSGGGSTTWYPEGTFVTTNFWETTFDPNGSMNSTVPIESTVWNPDNTIPVETTIWNPENTTIPDYYYTTIPEETTTVPVTTVVHLVEGEILVDPGSFASGYHWVKAFMDISTPNPAGSVKIQIAAEGNELGKPLAGHPNLRSTFFDVDGSVSSTGVFSGSCSHSVGAKVAITIGLVPGFPVSTDYVWGVAQISSVVVTADQIVVSGTVWQEMNVLGTMTKITPSKDWSVRVKKIR